MEQFSSVEQFSAVDQFSSSPARGLRVVSANFNSGHAPHCWQSSTLPVHHRAHICTAGAARSHIAPVGALFVAPATGLGTRSRGKAGNGGAAKKHSEINLVGCGGELLAGAELLHLLHFGIHCFCHCIPYTDPIIARRVITCKDVFFIIKN